MDGNFQHHQKNGLPSTKMKQANTSRSRHHRSGLSIIEVLTSIVVAMIGVFGVMVLIPFAVKQTQSGLDRDAATTMARNAMSQMEIQGYRNPETWTSAAGTAVNPGTAAVDPQPFFIDPLAVTYPTSQGLAADYTLFPNLLLQSATLPDGTTPAGVPSHFFGRASLFASGFPASPMAGVDMSLAAARKMFVANNQLEFDTPADELFGPIQKLNISSDPVVGNIGRQSRASLSWAVMMVPFKSSGAIVDKSWSFRSFVIVYKDRYYQNLADPASQMLAVQVNTTGPALPFTPPQLASPVGSVYIDTSNHTIPEDYKIARDDWVMMFNQADLMPAPPAVAPEPGFHHQIGFYRVVNYEIDGSGAAPVLQSLTLDGPDFDFNATTYPNGTYIIHLRDVIAVYERNVVEESTSNWN